MEQDTGGKVTDNRLLRPLLTKTTKPFLIYVLVVLALSIPVYYIVITNIWVTELDEYNKALAAKVEKQFNSLNLSNHDLKSRIAFWDSIHPETFIKELPDGVQLQDSIYTTAQSNSGLTMDDDDNVRVLVTTIRIHNKPYYFKAITSFENASETITAIGIVTFLFIGCILIGLLFLNRRLSKSAWQPFHNTLNKLRTFRLNQSTAMEFEKTDVKEFEELHHSLNLLMEGAIKTYESQKEFTENASHELQTPLAILKNKLDILLQNRELTEEQYHLVEDMNRTLARSTRINRDLLLLAKIDNDQFSNNDEIEIKPLLEQCMEMLEDYFLQKEIKIKFEPVEDVKTAGNKNLTEIMINNLLLNAIIHTVQKGAVLVSLDRNSLQISNSGDHELDSNLVFKRFSKQSGEKTGYGLGLSIVKRICDFQGWQIHYNYFEKNHIFTVNFSA